MLAKFLQLLTPAAHFFKDDDVATKLRTSRHRPHPPRMPLWLVAGWILIAVKCVALWWLIAKYQVPIHPLWLVIPTVLFGMLATAVYVWRD